MIACGEHNWYASSKQYVRLVALVILAMKDHHQIEASTFWKGQRGFPVS